MNEKSAIGERIKVTRTGRNLTQQQFADEVGTSRMTVSRYETGETVPDGTVLAQICEKYGVDATWLLLGLGEEEFSPASASETEAMESTGARILRLQEEVKALRLQLSKCTLAEDARFVKEMGLGDVALLARGSSQEKSWNIGCVLAAEYPGTLTPDEVASRLSMHGVDMDERDITQHLIMFVKRGLAVATGDEGMMSYRLAAPTGAVKASELDDMNAHAKEAVRLIVKRVLPTREKNPEHAELRTILATVDAGKEAEIIAELKEAVKEICGREAVDRGQRTLSVVLGVAFSDKDG